MTVFWIVVMVLVIGGIGFLAVWLAPKVDRMNERSDQLAAELKAKLAARESASARASARYPTLGPVAGTCTTCGRETYAIAGPALIRLTMEDQTDKVKSNAMWCLQCDALFCMGCAHSARQKCSACSGPVGDHYHRKPR